MGIKSGSRVKDTLVKMNEGDCRVRSEHVDPWQLAHKRHVNQQK